MRTSITVQNLRCGGCANTITKKLTALKGVSAIAISIETSQVSFETEDDTTVAKVTEQLKALGYPEENRRNSLSFKAKSFVSCATGKFSN